MSEYFDVSPSVRAQVLEARARVRSANQTIDNLLRTDALDPSLISAIQAIAEALRFIGEHAPHIVNEDSGITDRIDFLYALDQSSIDQYAEHTEDLLTVLNFIASFPDDLDDLADAVEELLKRVVGFLRELLGQESPMNSDLWVGVESQYTNSAAVLNSFALWRSSVQASKRAESAAEAAAESAGETAQTSLASEFESLRDAEKRIANWFRRSTIGLLLATLGFAAYIAFGEHDRAAAEAAQKLALAVPAVLLAAYLGREASAHRRTAHWATVMVAQLRSIRAYSAELSPQGRDELKLRFGFRVFLDAPALGGADEGASPSNRDLGVVQVIREASEAARPTRGV
ncbi:hypothetical protein [Aeromicrobium wangtongii]|uniref:DUF4231 domain-containing protein n=1 Tax=Aeromicrobium wangtongii TaxID=2969247 RepID=A0ABY5MCJ6_9ACTN|nr:hypothetical protein [Aeromicrobium wangtongii]MCD9197426.1 hypothetical protein [Aeromicrobium wangtongii]UUP14919.1 hypothetical protein NQV15_06315 [Aeromicrobium wangtongii]